MQQISEGEGYSLEFKDDLNAYFIYEATQTGDRRVLAAIQDNREEATKIFELLKNMRKSGGRRLDNTAV